MRKMRESYSTNEELHRLIAELRQASSVQKVAIWKRVAGDLSRPTRERREVNLSRINTFTKDDETIVVPGKVLSSGSLNHKVRVAAFNFSKSAAEKIEKSNGKAISINELLKSNPKGKGIRIIG